MRIMLTVPVFLLAAVPMALEEGALAKPFPGLVVGLVGVVVPAKGYFEAGECYPVSFLGVALGFFYLADETGVQHISPCYGLQPHSRTFCGAFQEEPESCLTATASLQ